MIPLPWQGDRDGSEIMIPLPYQWGRDLIFDAFAFKPTMVGRGTKASEQGAIKFLPIARMARRSVALPTRVSCEM